MTLDSLIGAMSVAIPIASFLALFVSVIIFVRYKGTMDALKEAAETYKSLAEAREATIDDLIKRIECNETQIAELQAQVEAQRSAVALAVDELLNGFVRHGICTKAATCKEYTAGGE